MIKAVFFDVDGTLQSFQTKTIPQSARDAIAKLQVKGIQCIVATGRQLGVMETLPVGDIPFDGYLTLNGQMMHDREKNLIMGVPLSGKVKEFLVDRFNDHTYPAMFVEEREVYVNYISDHVEAVSRWLGSENPKVRAYEGAEIYQVNAYLRPEEECFLDPIREDAILTRWHFGGMDVIGKGGGKVVGIRKYLEMNDILPEEIIAFGDAENDIEMIAFAGIGVAMGNAKDCVKECADYVTADVDDDGILKALQHFGLIE